jgi:hypothetical protein
MEESCSLNDNQKAQRDGGSRKEQGQDTPFKGKLPVTYFLQLNPAS